MKIGRHLPAAQATRNGDTNRLCPKLRVWFLCHDVSPLWQNSGLRERNNAVTGPLKKKKKKGIAPRGKCGNAVSNPRVFSDPTAAAVAQPVDAFRTVATYPVRKRLSIHLTARGSAFAEHAHKHQRQHPSRDLAVPHLSYCRTQVLRRYVTMLFLHRHVCLHFACRDGGGHDAVWEPPKRGQILRPLLAGPISPDLQAPVVQFPGFRKLSEYWQGRASRQP